MIRLEKKTLKYIQIVILLLILILSSVVFYISVNRTNNVSNPDVPPIDQDQDSDIVEDEDTPEDEDIPPVAQGQNVATVPLFELYDYIQTESNNNITVTSTIPSDSPSSELIFPSNQPHPESAVTLAFYTFYFSLRDKDFEKAYKIGAQGRTYERFVNLYKDVDNLDLTQAFLIGENTFIAQVRIRYGETVDFYRVLVEMGTDQSGENIIVRSNSEKYSGKVYLVCGKNDIGTPNPIDICIVKDWLTGDILRLDGYGITPNPFYQIQAKRVGNIKYISSNIFGITVNEHRIFAYNELDQSLKHIETLTLSTSHGIPGLSETDFVRNCDVQNLASFQPNGCAYQYRDSNWFKQNKNFLERIDLYFPATID